MDSADDVADLSAAALCRAWGSRPPPEQTALFSALPPEKRALAVERVTALHSLVSAPSAKQKPPTRKMQAEVAATLGVGLKRLQGMMRSWKEAPKLEDLVPRAKPERRIPRSNPSLDIAREIVAAAVSENLLVAEPTVRKRIALVLGKMGKPTPARATIVRMLTDARRKMSGAGGNATVATPAMKSSGNEQEMSPGSDLLLIDMAFAATLSYRSGAQAEATALIDLNTGYMVALAPQRDFVGLAASAETSLIHEPFSVGPWLTPARLQIAADLSSAHEQAIRRRAAAMQIDVKAASPVTRARRYAAASISFDAPLIPVPRRAPRSPIPKKWPPLDEEDFQRLLARTAVVSNTEVERRFDKRTSRKTLGGHYDLYASLQKLFVGLK